MELHHVVVSSALRAPLSTETRRREVVRTLSRVAGPQLVLFAVADEHIHAVVASPMPRRVGGAVVLALRARADTPALQPVWSEAVAGRAHLKRLVSYFLRQPEHHALGDPATSEGTCFLDLVGARRIDGFDGSAWRAHLPRETIDLIWSAVGLAPPPGVSLDGFALTTLIDAAGRATAADPASSDHAAPTVRARRVAAVLTAEAGFAADRVAVALGCTDRAVRRLRQAGANPDDVRAARRVLAIEAAVARRRGVVH